MDETKGIKAILYLQGTGDIKVDEAGARKSWKAMTEAEQDWTMQVYAMFQRRDGDGEQ